MYSTVVIMLDFLRHKYYHIVVAQKGGDVLSPRTGRPKAENPKTVEVKARIDAETNSKLLEYCKQHRKTRTEVIREGIALVLRQEK